MPMTKHSEIPSIAPTFWHPTELRQLFLFFTRTSLRWNAFRREGQIPKSMVCRLRLTRLETGIARNSSALLFLLEDGASVDEPLETAVSSVIEEAARICVSYGVDPQGIIEMYEGRAARRGAKRVTLCSLRHLVIPSRVQSRSQRRAL